MPFTTLPTRTGISSLMSVLPEVLPAATARSSSLVLPMRTAQELGVWQALDDVIMGGSSGSGLEALPEGAEVAGAVWRGNLIVEVRERQGMGGWMWRWTECFCGGRGAVHGVRAALVAGAGSHGTLTVEVGRGEQLARRTRGAVVGVFNWGCRQGAARQQLDRNAGAPGGGGRELRTSGACQASAGSSSQEEQSGHTCSRW